MVAFNRALFDGICGQIASGKSLREICRQPGMPDRTTFARWYKADPQLQLAYDEACRAREEEIFEQILEIADDTTRDTIATDYGEQPNNEWISRSRLRVDARKWILARMNRKKYGDKVDSEVELTGRIERITRQIVDPMGEDLA